MKLFTILMVTGLSSLLSLAWAEESPAPPNLPSSASTTLQEIEAAETASAAATSQPRGLGAPERVPVILEQTAHMQTADGKPAILDPGQYFIDVSPVPPLKVIRELDQERWNLAAQAGKHQGSVTEPDASASNGPGEQEYRLLLRLPNGTQVEARGSSGEIATRALRNQGVSTTLKVRVLPPKPVKTVYYQGLFRDRVIVKFKEGSVVRLTFPAQRSSKPTLALATSLMDPESRKRMQRLNLTDASVQADLATVNQILARSDVKALSPLFSRPDLFLRTERADAERRTGVEHADLGNYFLLSLTATVRGEEFADQLNALPSVEIAYLAPIPVDAIPETPPPPRLPDNQGDRANFLQDIPPVTPDYYANGYQGYLLDIESPFAWKWVGGFGTGVRIIDVENGWRLPHENLPQPFMIDGVFRGDGAHGTAVFGIIAASGAGPPYGIRGIAPGAKFGVVGTQRSPDFLNSADAINVAAGRLAPYDVILIELHAPAPSGGQTGNPNCNPQQFGFIAVEYWEAEFDAIQLATSRGIHVVEAAGNGAVNLDHAIYERRFDRTLRDSGAIMVGARMRAGQYPTCSSNSGSRLDVAAWGEWVWTTGGGTVTVAGAEGDPRQWYQGDFNGTSSASAIVAGAAASLMGIQRNGLTAGAANAGVHVLNPAELRTLLRETGRPQTASLERPIGPTVNLRNAFTRWSRGLFVPPAGNDQIFVP